MLALLATFCLAGDPGACADRLLPGEGCGPERAAAWAEARGDLALRRTRCLPLAEAMEPLPVVEVAPGVFVHSGAHAVAGPENRGDIAVAGFVVGTEAVAVIDAGGARGVGEALYAAVRAETDLPVRWLVLTHMHPDHVLGASVFAEAGAEIVGHASLSAALAARADSYGDAIRRALGPGPAIGSEIVLPDAGVAATRELDLGGRRLVLEANPTAHTDNDLTAFDTGTATWFLGDLVFDGHLPTVDGSVLGWLALLDVLERRDAARVVPGHGGPVLDWPEGAGPTRGYLEALVEATRAALARGESLGTAAPRIGRDLEADWQLFEEFHERNATAAYRELEWE